MSIIQFSKELDKLEHAQVDLVKALFAKYRDIDLNLVIDEPGYHVHGLTIFGQLMEKMPVMAVECLSKEQIKRIDVNSSINREGVSVIECFIVKNQINFLNKFSTAQFASINFNAIAKSTVDPYIQLTILGLFFIHGGIVYLKKVPDRIVQVLNLNEALIGPTETKQYAPSAPELLLRKKQFDFLERLLPEQLSAAGFNQNTMIRSLDGNGTVSALKFSLDEQGFKFAIKIAPGFDLNMMVRNPNKKADSVSVFSVMLYKKAFAAMNMLSDEQIQAVGLQEDSLIKDPDNAGQMVPALAFLFRHSCYQLAYKLFFYSNLGAMVEYPGKNKRVSFLEYLISKEAWYLINLLPKEKILD
ncbi:MAG: hypothetical protein V4496_06060 [Pseudomonadota bacterium]